ncbi:MAG: efflux RND transporter permease subunit, partial [Rikenellaceae bacterium]
YDEIGTLLGGSYIGTFNRFGRLYQTYIEAAPEFRNDGDALNNIYISNASGEQIPLSTVVSVRDTVGVNFISQFNLYESIAITANPANKVSSKQAMASIEKISSDTLPPDIAISWSGVSLQESEASQSGSIIYALALIFVFLSLAALYNSWSLPFSILLSVPIAVVGALLFTWFAHTFNEIYLNDIYLQISLVMLIGLAAKNSILVVEYAHKILLSENYSPLDAALYAAKLRVRPIIMTAFAFILGVMPLIFASGVYSTARNIMGVALVGGMLLATIGGIFIYPALYYLVAKICNFEKLAKTPSKS